MEWGRGGEPHPDDLSRCGSEAEFLERLRVAIADVALAVGALKFPVSPETQTWGSVASVATGIGTILSGVETVGLEVTDDPECYYDCRTSSRPSKPSMKSYAATAGLDDFCDLCGDPTRPGPFNYALSSKVGRRARVTSGGAAPFSGSFSES